MTENEYFAKLAFDCRKRLCAKRTRAGGDIDRIKDESIIEGYIREAYLEGYNEGYDNG